MRLLGIDYGTKRIGIATTDESGRMAFPKATLANDRYFLSSLKELIESGNVKKVIIGESLNRDGAENEIMGKVRELAGYVEREFGIPVEYEAEMYSSEEAKRLQNNELERNALTDASAAAIILNSFLERQRNKKMHL